MVCEWGMSDALGPLTYGKREEAIFLGKEFNRHQDYSDDTALKIDAEIKRIVSEQYERATRVLTDKRAELVNVAEMLLEHEVLDNAQLRRVIDGLPLEAPTRPPRRASAAPAPREERIKEPERSGGLLPPAMAAPKPTS